MSLLEMGLGLAGMPSATIQELDKQLPALERLAADMQAAEPHITAMMPHVTALLPILQKAMPDIVAVTPLLQQLIAFAKSKSNVA